ncbi:MAG: fibronectin type III domain-containing protein, partial [Burkholderiales bacterium]|nr:fibronectin type III domain-containing protein [Opitutaceae bacterium]
DNASNETGFKLERSANGTTGWSQIAAPAANSTSYADTGLTASTTYHYRVRATNGSSDSAYSNSANATTSPSGGGTNQSQSITFAALPAKVVTDPDFTLSATASSGLTVSYSSSNTAVATVSGNTVNILTAGTTTITASQSGDATYAAATPVPQTLTVSQATQTITFAPLASVIATDADFTLTGSASSGLPVSYVSSDTAVATVSGNIVNVHAAGSTVITASQSGDATYSAATNVPQTLTVNPAAVASAVMVYEPFNYSPTSTNPDPDGAGIANGGNGLPATNVGGMPADTSTGLRGNYGADQTVVAGLTYSDANGTLTTSANALRRTSGTNWSAGAVWLYRFMNVDPFAAYRSGASTNWFGWNASSGPRELYFSVLLSASSLNTGADNRLILMLGRDNVQHNVYLGQNTGSVWRVTDSGTTNLTLGSAVANQTVLVVGRLAFNSATQFVTDYWFNPALGAALGAPAASLTYTTTTSGGQFLGLQTRDGANILTIDEFRLGTTYAAVTPYSSLPSAPVALAASVASASQLNLTWIDTAANETGFKIERSANGTTGWTQIAAPAANATSYSDSGLSAATTYYYRVLATNAAGDSAASASASATTLQLAQSISFAALPDKLVTDAAFALTATASSGLPVSYVSTDPAVATVSGNTVTIVGAGTTTITASQSGNTTYSAATNVSQALTVNKVGQAITFGALASRTYGGASFTLTGSASSGLPVSYVSSNPSVANVSGSTVTLYTAGTTVITAAQSGDATYSAAASVPQTLTVNKATQSITFPAIPTKTPTSPAFALTATASSGLPVSYVSSNLAVATVEGATVTIEGSGTSTFTASQAGDANYLPAANATQVLTVNPALVIIHERFNYTVGSTNPDPDDNGNANFGNGLPATNIGGTPSGVSTGLRSSWGTTTTVVTGLSYTRNGKTLVTSGAAGRVNKTGWGGQPFIYRSMSADPFLANRIGGVNTGNLGVPGSSLYVSLLAQTSSATADAFRLSFKHDGSANLYLTNTATGWAINNGSGNIVAAGAPLALSTPTLLVLRFDFAASSTAVSLWVNPVLGDPLGTPAATITSMFFPGLSNLQTRPSVANAMTFDELRIGQDLSAVTPFTSP